MKDTSEIRPRMVDGDAMCVPESCIYWQDAFRTCTITYCQTNECWPYYRAALAESQEEMGEQCRLLGMGAEREAILLSRVESLEAALNEGAPCAICSHVEREAIFRTRAESAEARVAELEEVMEGFRGWREPLGDVNGPMSIPTEYMRLFDGILFKVRALLASRESEGS